MAKRIIDITKTATSTVSDDYMMIDGVTRGTRKILFEDACSDLLNNVYKFNVMEIPGVIGDGINNDGVLITNFLSTQNKGITLTFPDDKIFKGDITISNTNISLVGRSTILGTIYFKFDSPTYTGIRVEDLKIKAHEDMPGYQDSDKSCVILENCRDIHFVNCNFYNGLYGIEIAEINVVKHSGCMTIDGCTFSGCNYDLYSVNPNFDGYTLMNTQFTNCQSYSARIGSIKVAKVDGLIVSNNTFFMTSYTVQEPQKKNNIFIDGGNFINISNNNIFEAGEDAIYMKDFGNATICNNNIARSGQCRLSSGIHLVSSATSKTGIGALVRCNVQGNTIENSSLYGINIDGYFQGLNISNNTILLNSGMYYYGDRVLGLPVWNSSEIRSIYLNPSYGSECSINIMNNNYYANTAEVGDYDNVKVRNNLSKNGIEDSGFRKFIFTNSRWGTTNLNYDKDTTFSNTDLLIIPAERTLDLLIRNIGPGVNYKKIRIINLNSTQQVTISHNYVSASVKMLTKNGNDISMSFGSSREFMFYEGNWIEI